MRVYFIGYGHPQQCVTTFEQKPKIRVIEHNALVVVLYIHELLRCSNGFASIAARNELDWRQRYGQSVESACRL